MKLGCIADDYTGATDLGSSLRSSGASVRLHFGIPNFRQDSNCDIEIIAIKCRTAPIDIAVNSCRAAGNWLLAGGAVKLYWKYCSTFDSTAKGNIGPVAEALMKLTGQTQALYCPAYPKNKRSVFMGHLFVNDQLLNESSLKDHPLTPMTDANLCRVLETQVTRPVGLWSLTEQRSHKPIPMSTHVIADAVEFEDLTHIIEKTPDNVLLTGGSALALPILKKLGLIRSHPIVNPSTASPALILSGSCSEMTNRQVQQYKADAPSFRLNPLALAKTGLKECLQWLEMQSKNVTPLIFATTTPDEVKRIQKLLGRQEAGQIIEQAMASITQFAQKQGVRRFVVAGGETAGAVVQALGIECVEIGTEICSGVPWVFANQTSDPIGLALKSGNFGSETFFSDALAQLE